MASAIAQSHAKRAAIASALIFPGAGLFMLGQHLRGAIFAVPSVLIIALLFKDLMLSALSIQAELQAQLDQSHSTQVLSLLREQLPIIWHRLHRALFESSYWAQGRWLLLAAWLCSIISAYQYGQQLDRQNSASKAQ